MHLLTKMTSVNSHSSEIFLSAHPGRNTTPPCVAKPVPKPKAVLELRSVPHLWGLRAPSLVWTCLQVSPGVSHPTADQGQISLQGGEQKWLLHPNHWWSLGATHFIHQPSLPSLCIFHPAPKSAFNITCRFWPSLHQVAKLHQRSLASACPRGYVGRASPAYVALWWWEGNSWGRKRKRCRNKKQLCAKNRETYWEGKDGMCVNRVESRGEKGYWCGEREAEWELNERRVMQKNFLKIMGTKDKKGKKAETEVWNVWEEEILELLDRHTYLSVRAVWGYYIGPTLPSFMFIHHTFLGNNF